MSKLDYAALGVLFVFSIVVFMLIWALRKLPTGKVKLPDEPPKEYTGQLRCTHTSAYSTPGEPTIGDYIICNRCGAVFNSENQWLAAHDANHRYNEAVLHDRS